MNEKFKLLSYDDDCLFGKDTRIIVLGFDNCDSKPPYRVVGKLVAYIKDSENPFVIEIDCYKGEKSRVFRKYCVKFTKEFSKLFCRFQKDCGNEDWQSNVLRSIIHGDFSTPLMTKREFSKFLSVEHYGQYRDKSGKIYSSYDYDGGYSNCDLTETIPDDFSVRKWGDTEWETPTVELYTSFMRFKNTGIDMNISCEEMFNKAKNGDKSILTLPKEKLMIRDNDGWTPIYWLAIRGVEIPEELKQYI